MKIRIDVSKISGNVKNDILSKISYKYATHINNDIIEIDSIMGEIKVELNSILSIYGEEYVVAENTEKQNQLVILKNGDIEQLGLFICIHCGTVFSSNEERDHHLKLHYII